MKKITISNVFIGMLSIGMLITTSCKDSFWTDANVNPNAPPSIVPSALVTTVEAGLGYTQGGDLSRFSCLISQQTFGAARQAQGYYTYTFTTQDFDTEWGNIYTTVMQNDMLLIQLADEKNYNTYGGIARILLAYALQITTDTYGDIPFSDAFKGVSNFHPKYDKSQDIYATINTLLDDAITKLNSTEPGDLVPGGDDFMYGGDVSLWIKFAHAIKARMDIHQSKSDPSKATAALTEVAASFTSNDENAIYVFGETETSSSPAYQFNENRGDISFATSTLAEMWYGNDPRGSILIDSATDGDGTGLAGFGGTFSRSSNYVLGAINSPVEFICYDELQFINAEATLRSTGNVSEAQGFYQAGIRANMEKLLVPTSSIDTYIAANGTLSSDVNTAIGQVGTQEYFALYLNPESWTVYRRTGAPALVGVGGAEVPRRLYYPQSEYSYNGDNVPASTLYSPKVFWDN